MKKLIVVVVVGLVAMGIMSSDRIFGADASTKKGGSQGNTSALRAGAEHNVVKEDGRTVIYKKRSVVDFDDSLIEGEVRNPNEFYFVHRPEEKFGTLVKKRPHFHKEMLRDTVMIR
ncbi:MAG: hypothetical protein HYW49_12280 [Deltaproteobacteria bacterium]|nr:hypothetical protein [Deltaproteobacteria bacterium]